jgi:CysZ protein
LQFFVVPWFVNGVLGVAIYASLFRPIFAAVSHSLDHVNLQVTLCIASWPQWLQFLEQMVWFLTHVFQWGVMIALFLLTGFLLLQFGTLIGAPWYGKLSEEIERYRLGAATTVEVGILTDLGRALLFEVKKLILWGTVAAALLVLNFIPAVGTAFVTAGWMILTGLIACLDFLDGPSERRRLRFRQKVAIALKALPASASFSFVCCVLLSVPLLNLLTIPLCVASGTLFWCDRVFPRLPEAQKPRENRMTAEDHPAVSSGSE